MKEDKSGSIISINVTPVAVLKIVAILVLCYFAYLVRDVLLIVLTSVIIASAIEPALKYFSKYKIPRAVSAIGIYLFVATILTFVFYFFLPELISDTKTVVSSLPKYVDTITTSSKITDFPVISRISDAVFSNINSTEVVQQIGGTVSGATFGALTTLTAIFGGIFSFILIVVLSFYLAVQESGVSNFLKIITPIQYEPYITNLWQRFQTKIGLWLQGQLVLALVVGLLIYPVLVIFGVENAMFLAFLAMIFEIIPIFGPFLAAIPAVAFATMQDGLTLGLMVAAWYLIVQQFENHIFHPLVVKKIVGIPAIVSILSLIIGAKIAGFLGILIAVPVATLVMEILSDYEKSKMRKLSN
jgi:predicted PurR-regulated permease PerM